MKVLWFEVTTPSKYSCNDTIIAGWQDSLESIVSLHKGIELSVAFISTNKDDKIKSINGITYIPVILEYNIIEKIRRKLTWKVDANKYVPALKRVIQDVMPDIIHVFGTEWPFGLVTKSIQVPVVVHIMGSVTPYINAFYPVGFNLMNEIISLPFYRIDRMVAKIIYYHKYQTWTEIEADVWNCVKFYMGRTDWDKSLSRIMHPGRMYYHVEEAMRPIFFSDKYIWKGFDGGKLRLITIGCSSYWKGPDMLLKTASILTSLGIQYEWIVAGLVSREMIDAIENKTHLYFKNTSVIFVGQMTAEQLCDKLSSSTFYVHTAYIENSPNSICEAQLLGIPIISTNVGGIKSLIGDYGKMVPANDPWQMADAVIQLSKDYERMERYSKYGREQALMRHNEKNILKQLLDCYSNIVTKSNGC